MNLDFLMIRPANINIAVNVKVCCDCTIVLSYDKIDIKYKNNIYVSILC